MNDIQPGQNLGVIEAPQKPEDYVSGVSSPIPFVVNVADGNWQPFESAGERQAGVYFDSMACVTFS